MATNYLQPGDVIQYTAGADISSGDAVVINNMLGVALVDIANGETGSVALRGVFTMPAVSAAVITRGETMTWDVSANSGAGAFDDDAATPATGDLTGACAVAWADSGNGDTTVQVLLTGVPGTVN